MKKVLPFALAAAFALGACGTGSGGGGGNGGGSGITKIDAEGAITAAEHEAKRANSKGYEWRDTGKMIKEAKEAFKENDFAKAHKLANKAKRQSENALKQYEEQKNASPRG